MTKLEEDTRLVAEYDGFYSIRSCGHILLYGFGLEGYRTESIGKYERVPYYHNSEVDITRLIFKLSLNYDYWCIFVKWFMNECDINREKDEFVQLRKIILCSPETKFNAVVNTIKELKNE